MLMTACVCVFQNRAQAATELLQELNSDVSGNFVEEVCLEGKLKHSYICFSLDTWFILCVCFLSL